MQRRDLLAQAARPAKGGGVRKAAPCFARRVEQGRPPGLVEGQPRFGQHPREKGGGKTGPNPLDRGRFGSKRHLVADAGGLPLAAMLPAVNVHDSKVFEELVDSVPPVLGARGRPRKRPDKLHADKGYDYPRCRRFLRRRGIRARIARRGVESSERLGRWRPRWNGPSRKSLATGGWWCATRGGRTSMKHSCSWRAA